MVSITRKAAVKRLPRKKKKKLSNVEREDYLIQRFWYWRNLSISNRLLSFDSQGRMIYPANAIAFNMHMKARRKIERQRRNELILFALHYLK